MLTHYYSVGVFGKYAIVALTVSLVGMLGNGLFSQVFLRRNPHSMPCMLPLTHHVTAIQFAFAWLILAVVVPTEFGAVTYLLVLPCILTNFLTACLESSYVKRGKISIVNKWQVLSVSSGAALSISAATLETFDGLTVMTSALCVKSCIMALGLYRKDYLGERPATRARRLRYYMMCAKRYRGYLYSSWLGYLLNSVDRWLAVAISSVEAVAFYSRAHQLMNVPLVFFNRMIAKDIQFRLLEKQAVALTIAAFLGLALLTSGILYGLGEHLTVLVLGEEWRATGVLLGVLGLLLMPRILLKLTDVYIRAYFDGSVYVGFYLVQLAALATMLTTCRPASVLELANTLVLSACLSVVLVALAYLGYRVTSVRARAG